MVFGELSGSLCRLYGTRDTRQHGLPDGRFERRGRGRLQCCCVGRGERGSLRHNRRGRCRFSGGLPLGLLLGLEAGVGLTGPSEGILINAAGAGGWASSSSWSYRLLLGLSRSGSGLGCSGCGIGSGRGLSGGRWLRGLFRLGGLGVLGGLAALEPVENHRC